MTQIHAVIHDYMEATEDAYQAEKHAQLLGALAGLLAPHLDQLIDARVKRAVDDLNDRDLGLVRAVVREELDDQADDLEEKVNDIINEREFVDSDDVDDKIAERIDETLRERELVRKDELDDKIAEILGTFAEGDTMRDKIQDALADMTGSFTLSRY
jgi:DNA-binding transcriptional MerR regulator